MHLRIFDCRPSDYPPFPARDRKAAGERVNGIYAIGPEPALPPRPTQPPQLPPRPHRPADLGWEDGPRPPWSGRPAWLDRFPARDRGQGLAEYVLILSLIALVAIVALIYFGGQVSTLLSTVGSSV